MFSTEQYLVPLGEIPKDFKSGFLTMAAVCLLIETLQQFYCGKNETEGKHDKAFKSFFKNEQKFNLFLNCAANYGAFYKNIRCGILHQAETKGGYRILWDGLLFDGDKKTVNAAAFMSDMKLCLDNYISRLRQSKSNGTPLKEALLKLHFICKNCQAT